MTYYGLVTAVLLMPPTMKGLNVLSVLIIENLHVP